MQVKLTKTPATGMRDILPREMEIRNRALFIIREAYAPYGFLPLETPCVEHLENLNCKAGGENEKLTFKILKRGEKLKIGVKEGIQGYQNCFSQNNAPPFHPV